MVLPHTLKSAARSLWFTTGASRRCFWGPYSGLMFHLSPALSKSRMSVFYQAYEREVTEWLNAAIQPGTVFYDVGAHIGIHTLYVAKLLEGNGHIHAFEPWPDNFLQLKKNVELNGFSDVITAEPLAISDRIAVSAMSPGDTDGTHHLTDSDGPEARHVNTTTLDQYSHTTRPPHVLKVDVEGWEFEVLSGGRDLLTRHRPKLILEHHGETLRERSADLLRSFGYRVARLGTRHICSV